MRRPPTLPALAAVLLFGALSAPAISAVAAPAAPDAEQTLTSYLVVLDSDVSGAVARQLVAGAGGTVTSDLTEQIGVVLATSAVPGFDATLRASNLVLDAGEDRRFRGLPDGGPQASADPLESVQWDMEQIRTEEAHAVQAGSPLVDVGILDSGIDGAHPDFERDGVSNIDCERGRDFVPLGPSVAHLPGACVDNQFHGTHVAGSVAARANGRGLVGVAPNVTLVPVKVCDSEGYCFQCNDDPQMRAMRRAAERAIAYAIHRGVTPVAALGNSDQDLAHPVDGNGQPIPDDCEVVPAETSGVIGTTSLGPDSEKADYSNYGDGEADVAAPGGNGSTGDCTTTILSTAPGGGYICIQGTSMASPHAAGVAALIVSQFGTLGRDGDVTMSPERVAGILQSTAVDIGLRGHDECFGHGRIDALRAVTHDTSTLRQANPPCPE
jgi:subtilisin family serine protease